MAIRSFGAINGRTFDTILEILENSDDETFRNLEGVILETLRLCSSRGGAIELKKKMFNLLEKNPSQNMKERVNKALAYVQGGQRYV